MNRNPFIKYIIAVAILGVFLFIFFRPKTIQEFSESVSTTEPSQETARTEIKTPGESPVSTETSEALLPTDVITSECPSRENIQQNLENLNARLLEGFKDHCHSDENASECSKYAMMDENLGQSGPLAYEIYDVIDLKQCEKFLILARKGLNTSEAIETPFKVDYEGFVLQGKKATAVADIGNVISDAGAVYIGTFTKTCGLQNNVTVISKKGNLLYEGEILKGKEADIRRLKVSQSAQPEITLEYLQNPHGVGETIVREQVSVNLTFKCPLQGGDCSFVAHNEHKKNVSADQEDCQ